MSQKKNKFLTGYFTVLGIGAAGLGYLTWSAWSNKNESAEKYAGTRSKLESLYKAKVFPSAENVEAKKKQVAAYVEKVRELDNAVMVYQPKLDNELNVQGFQARLQQYRDAAVAAAGSQVTLPSGFDMGMGAYLSGFPNAKAVPELSFWLEGINFLVNGLIEKGVYSIDSVKRPEMPFEKGEPAAEPAPDPKKKAAPKRRAPKRGAKAAEEEQEKAPALDESGVIKRYPVAITFTASNRAVNDVLTLLANTSPDKNSPYFFVIRNIRVENEKKDGPLRNFEVQVREETPTGEGEQPFKRDAVYIFGGEKVQVYLDIDLLRFLEPSSSTPQATTAAK